MRLLLIISFLFVGCTSNINFEEIDTPAKNNGKYPRLFTDNSGTIFMSWMEENGDSTRLLFSSYQNETWSEPQMISESDSWFVNWADFPSVIGYNGNPLAAHWLQKSSGGPYSYDVNIKNLVGESSKSFVPHNDNTPTEHGFVSMSPISDSSYHVIWLDGRNTLGENESDSPDTYLSNAMTLRGALIQNNEIVIEQEIDPNICDCCSTSLVQVSDGVLAAYRNRTENEIRDIYVSKLLFETNKWSEPISVNEDDWQIAACPVNGPMMDAIDNTVAIAWFTGANNQPNVKVKFSDDAGLSWQSPIILDNEVPLGRVDVVLKNSETAFVSWMTRVDNSAVLKLAQVSKNGQIIRNSVISEIDPSRSTGFPQLTSYGDGLMISWTDVSGSTPMIKTGIIR